MPGSALYKGNACARCIILDLCGMVVRFAANKQGIQKAEPSGVSKDF